jgi:hypothetical protein
MLQKNLKKLKKLIIKKSKKFKTKIELFMDLHKTNRFTRLDMMIIDSVTKGMPLENLYKTLLLTEESYNRTVAEIIKKLTI